VTNRLYSRYRADTGVNQSIMVSTLRIHSRVQRINSVVHILQYYSCTAGVGLTMLEWNVVSDFAGVSATRKARTIYAGAAWK